MSGSWGVKQEQVWAGVQRRTWVWCDAVVQTSRGEASRPIATETGLGVLSWAALWHAAVLLSHQRIGRVEKLSVGHSLKTGSETLSM